MPPKETRRDIYDLPDEEPSPTRRPRPRLRTRASPADASASGDLSVLARTFAAITASGAVSLKFEILLAKCKLIDKSAQTPLPAPAAAAPATPAPVAASTSASASASASATPTVRPAISRLPVKRANPALRAQKAAPSLTT